MIKVVCTILTIAIKNLGVHLGNLNLLLRNNVIGFELLVLKKKTNKQMIGALYY